MVAVHTWLVGAGTRMELGGAQLSDPRQHLSPPVPPQHVRPPRRLAPPRHSYDHFARIER
eukprot:5309235-Prymnesium_polylepis.1